MNLGPRFLILGTPSYAFHCIDCGVAFTVPCEVADKHYRESGFHYCPNGHSQGWPKGGSENDRLRRERDRLKQENARLADAGAAATRRAAAERERAEKAEASIKRHRRRAAAGLCPCCRRSFANMAAHMKREHPDFGKAAA